MRLVDTCNELDRALKKHLKNHVESLSDGTMPNYLRALVRLGSTQIDRARFAFAACASPGYPEDIEAGLLDRFAALTVRVEQSL